MGRIINRRHQKRTRQYLRTHSTRSEILLWCALKGRRMEGVKFRRQHGILEYVADFYCPELRLAIESLGIRVLRYRDEAVNENVDAILAKIQTEVVKRKVGG